ncbi:hypothetical protein EMIT0347P_10477 [Pseudomonas sp. IT-347P]
MQAHNPEMQSMVVVRRIFFDSVGLAVLCYSLRGELWLIGIL